MASITLKDIPKDIHARLKSEAEANYRSMGQEVLARVERSFAFEDQLTTQRVDRLIDESIASGDVEKFSKRKFDAAIQSARAQFARRSRGR